MGIIFVSTNHTEEMKMELIKKRIAIEASFKKQLIF